MSVWITGESRSRISSKANCVAREDLPAVCY